MPFISYKKDIENKNQHIFNQKLRENLKKSFGWKLKTMSGLFNLLETINNLLT